MKLYCNSFWTHRYNKVNSQILWIRLLADCAWLSQANSSLICSLLKSILTFPLQVSRLIWYFFQMKYYMVFQIYEKLLRCLESDSNLTVNRAMTKSCPFHWWLIKELSISIASDDSDISVDFDTSLPTANSQTEIAQRFFYFCR